MLRKSVLAIGGLALVSATLLWGQGEMRRQQGFTDCDLDIRPSSKNEVQVYWVDLPPPPVTTPPTPPQIGMQFRLWAPEDNLVRIDFPDGSPGLDLKAGWQNTVTFVYTGGTTPEVTMTICTEKLPGDCGQTQVSKQVDFGGSYIEGGALMTPMEREARADETDHERLFIYGWNRGLEFKFLLRRNYP